MGKQGKRRHAKTKQNKKTRSQKTSFMGNEEFMENKKIDNDTKVVYSIFFDPENPKHNIAWNDIYQSYMRVLEIEDPEYYETVRAIEFALDFDLRFRAVLLLFKKVIPTIDPNDSGPIMLLKFALEEAIKKESFNSLCLFMQLATIHSYEIQKRYEKNALSRPGRIANSLSEGSSSPEKREESGIIYPVFNEMKKRDIKFPDGYKDLLVYAIIKHEDYFLWAINKYKDEKERNEIIKLHSRLKEHQERKEKEKEYQDTQDIVSHLLKQDPFRKNYYDKYTRFLKRNYEWISFKRIGISIHSSTFYSIFWEKMKPWPILELSKPYRQSIKEILEPSGIIPLSKQSVRQILICCKDNPQRIQEINKMLSNYNLKTNRQQLMMLVDNGYLDMINPNNQKGPNQKYQTSESGIQFLNQNDQNID